MRGSAQLKHRHSTANERRAVWNSFRAAAAKTYQIKRVYREDLLTGEITESSRSKMNSEIGYFTSGIFKPVKWRRYALPQSLIWEELEAGATLFTETAKFWIENARQVPPPSPPKARAKICKTGACNDYGTPSVKNDLCIDCYEQKKSNEFFRSEEVERIYFDVV